MNDLAEELDLPPNDELEEFIIDAIQVHAISVAYIYYIYQNVVSCSIQGKLNEITRTLVVSSFQHRQFAREQWQTLQVKL